MRISLGEGKDKLLFAYYISGTVLCILHLILNTEKPWKNWHYYSGFIGRGNKVEKHLVTSLRSSGENEDLDPDMSGS